MHVDFHEPIRYARQRASETGHAYIISEMGHVVLDVPHNRAMFKSIGVAIAVRVTP